MLLGNNIYKTTIVMMAMIEKDLLPLTIDLKLGIDFGETEPYKQLMAFDRVSFMLNGVFNGAIVIGRDHKKYNQFHNLFDTQIVECWTTPYDQFLGFMIYAKMNAILEDSAYINMISIECHGGEGMEFVWEADELFPTMTEECLEQVEKLKPLGLTETWPYRSDLTTNDHIVKGTLANIDDTWEDIGLGWELPAGVRPKPKHKNNVTPFIPRVIK